MMDFRPYHASPLCTWCGNSLYESVSGCLMFEVQSQYNNRRAIIVPCYSGWRELILSPTCIPTSTCSELLSTR